MRVAVTGATGFVGHHLLPRLLQRTWQVRALARNPGKLGEAENLTVVQGDLGDRQTLADLIEDCDLVLHLAGLVNALKDADYHRVNAEGTGNLLDAMAERAPRARLVLLSSLAAGEPGLSSYAASKAQAESLVRDRWPEAQFHMLRAPAVYGPGDEMTLPIFQSLSRGFVLAPNPKVARFSMIYVEDLADALISLAEEAWPTQSLSSISDEMTTGYGWADLAEKAEALFKRPIRCLPLPYFMASLFASLDYTWSSLVQRKPLLTHGKKREIFHIDWVSKEPRLDQLTPWRPKVPLESGLALTIDWYRISNRLK